MAQIIVLQPTRGILYTDVQNALDLELLRNEQFGFPIRTNSVPLPDCRNQLVEMALKESQWTHALLVDDDVVIPEGGLKAMLDLDVDVAMIDYPHHQQGWDKETLQDLSFGTCVYQNWKSGEKADGKEVVYGGLGCSLVKREVFEKLAKPWFRESSYIYHRDKNTGFLRITDEEYGQSQESKGAGEDAYFFKNAATEGFKFKVVPDMVATHLRLVRALPRQAMGRYRSSHTIYGNNKIDRPLI